MYLDAALRQHFLSLLPSTRGRQLEARRDSACGLWPNLRVAYVNPAWRRFARENEGAAIEERWCEGAHFLDAISTPLRDYYERHLLACLEHGTSWVSGYECSSPDTYRVFRMSVRPFAGRRALLVLHTCVEEAPHASIEHDRRPVPERYVDVHGVVQQCFHCRRVRRNGRGERWDWVPEWVAHVPDNASGGLCPACLRTRYPDLHLRTA